MGGAAQGWWQASDGRWYSPEQHPGYSPPTPPPAMWGPAPGPYGFPPGAPSAVPVTSGLAIAALVLSLLWLGGLGSLVAVVLAGVAMADIRASRGRRQGRGLATAGLVIGVVGVLTTAALFGYAATRHDTTATPPVANVPASPAALAQAVLAPSDFATLKENATGWTSMAVVDPSVFGAQSIAHDFADCLGVQSTLLGESGPGGRASSPLFTSGLYTVSNLVAVESSVATAAQVVRQTDRVKASSCITDQLTSGWRQFIRASGIGPTGGDLNVAVRPLSLDRAGDQSTAFTFFFNDSNTPGVSLIEDVAIVRQGQKDAMLTFLGIGSPVDATLEQQLDAAADAHLRSLVLVHGGAHSELTSLDRQ